METIRFANGAVYDCSHLATINDNGTMKAFIALNGVSFAEAAQIFSDENMTREMEWANYRLVGYTQLVAISVQTYGIQALLTGGHDERIA